MDSRTLVFAVILLACVEVLGQNPEAGINRTQERAVFFSGKVVLEDGSAPPDSVLIQRVCNGRTRNEGWTDSKGRFGFKVEGSGGSTGTADASQASAPPADLSQPFGSSTQYSMPVTSSLKDCELQAVLAGFQSDRVNMALKSTLDNARVGTIILHPLSRGNTLAVSATTLAAPSNAIKDYEKGLAAMKDQRWDAAADNLAKAVKAYPAFAAAWYELGIVSQKRNDLWGAVGAWKEALKADPKYVRPYESLTTVADAKENWAESEKYSRDWIQLDPEDFPAAYLFNAIANARLNKIDEAEHAAREGLRIDKDHKIVRLNYVLGLILMQKHEFAESAKYFHTYLELAPNARDAAIVREQLPKIEQAAAASPAP